MRRTATTRQAKVLVLAWAALFACLSIGERAKAEHLPSWNDTPAKQAIVDYVSRATDESGPGYVPVEERIAVFDNDGTLWPEQPLVQVQFALSRLQEMAAKDPSLALRQPYKAALQGDEAYFNEAGKGEAMKLLARTHSDMSQQEFKALARDFLAEARHPGFGVKFTELAYAPMVELLAYLRANGFATWICSGGGMDFIRTVSQSMYAVPPEQVIGSSLQQRLVDHPDGWLLWRESEIDFINDKETKPVGIERHTGRVPVFAAGNVRSGGDIAMLRYSQGGEYPSFQLLVNHDDAKREFAYGEDDNASIAAARENGWIVVSMANDWRRIFSMTVGKGPGGMK